jgi:asparagine synthase (glutamine-hydrolysing)
MAKMQSHRGPDAEGIFYSKRFGVSHCRLAIIDTSVNSNQPLSNENYSLVYNGEIYNWKELRQEFGLNSFEVTSDTQLLFKLLQLLPIKKLVPKLRGIFAFAFVNKNEGTTSLVRDRFGTKPIYTTYQNSVRYFSSEIKAFKSIPNASFTINEKGLKNYLTFQNNFGNKTIFEGIELLSAGTLSTIHHSTPEKIVEEKLFSESEAVYTKMDRDEASEEVRRLLEQSISRNLVSDVEIGGFLSSGIDSSLIAALSSQKNSEYRTFTIGFDTTGVSQRESGYDESQVAMRIAREFGILNNSKIISESHIPEVLDEVSWAIEDPRVGQSYPNYFASQMAAEHVKVCLSGTGGDEIFAGYPWRYEPLLLMGKRELQTRQLLNFWHRLGTTDEISALLGVTIGEHESESLHEIEMVLSQFVSQKETLKLDDILKFEQKTFLHGLLIVEDKLSMRHSLEVRVPFLDEDLVNFASKLPDSLRFEIKTENVMHKERNNESVHFRSDGKRVLREIAKSIIPESANLKKQGFSAPDETWFRRDQMGLIENRLLNDDSRVWQHLNHKVGTKLINDHLTGNTNRRLLIWSLLTLESTLRQFDL